MFPATPLPEPSLPDRFALIVHLLLRTLFEKVLRRPWLAPLIWRLHHQLRRKIEKFAALHAKYRAGTLRPPRQRPPRPPCPEAPRPEAPPRERLPHGPWLPRLVQETACHGSQLQHLLLHDPEIGAFLAAAPRAGRLLRPLCRMLGIDLPPMLRPPPNPEPTPRVRTPSPLKPPRPTAAEERAFLWHHRSTETDDGSRSPTRRPWWLPSKRR